MNMDANSLRVKLKQYAFYHTIKLTDEVTTEGWSTVIPIVNMTLRAMQRVDFRGKRVLDIGCRDGLFCYEAEKLGAAEVIGFDNDPSPGATEFLFPFFNSKVAIHELNIYDLKPETFGRFDLVLFPGLLYHLRYPFWALKLVRDVLKEDGHLILETAIMV